VLALSAPASATAAQVEAVVVEVTQVENGDTLEVLWNDDRRTVRLFGTDAPENGQSYFARARDLATALAAGENVQLVPVEERDGTMLVRIRLPDGRELNQVMVRNGLAWYVESSGATDLARLEQRARDERRGLWSESQPRPPWEYRQVASLRNSELIERLEPEGQPQRTTDDAFWTERRSERESLQRDEERRRQKVRDWYASFRTGILPVETSLNAVLEARTKYRGMGPACRDLGLAVLEFKSDESLANPPEPRVIAALSEMLGALGHMVRACQSGQDHDMAEFYGVADQALTDLVEALYPYTGRATANPEG
jgi:endonuclease YncB( thermonuclease family)